MAPRYDQCCNPFKITNHGKKSAKNLRWINSDILKVLQRKLNFNLKTNEKLKICDSCRLKVLKMPASDSESSESILSDDNVLMPKPGSSGQPPSVGLRKTDSDSSISSSSIKIDKFNDTLVLLKESPIKKTKLLQKNYPINKRQRIVELIDKEVFHIEHDGHEDEKKNSENLEDILSKLKEQFKNSNDRQFKFKILTIFADWSYKEIQKHFIGASNHMIFVVKKSVQEKGILSSPNRKSGKTLHQDVVQLILHFYESQEISREMPGQKDCITIRNGDEKVKIQKKLVLCNLREAHALFKERYPNLKVQFSKFAALRPKHCILAGASGTHSVCVCCIHQNVKLMIDGAGLSKLTADSLKLATYKDSLSRIICNIPTTNCFLQQCVECPGCDILIEQLRDLFQENMIDQIIYRQWVTVDRTSLETLQSSTEEYLDKLADKLRRLLTHAYIAKEQSTFFNQKKTELQPGECVVICDFSENYAFVYQDAIQGVHWNNDQVTIHPFAIYYKNNEKEQFINYIAISDCLKHDTIAVHLFQRGLITFLKKTLGALSTIYYFSDGASAQYKNKKNFINVCFHEDDFNVKAEWHFFATSHGKGPCDGLGGTIKRLVARASLQNVNDPINTAAKFFTWVNKNVSNVNSEFFTIKEYKKEERILNERFNKAKIIQGTVKYHSFIPQQNGKIEVRITSSATTSTVKTMYKE